MIPCASDDPDQTDHTQGPLGSSIDWSLVDVRSKVIITAWVMRAGLGDLVRAAQSVRLSEAAVRAEPPNLCSDSEASLIYPSGLCPEPRPWLLALAFLVQRRLPVRLQVITAYEGEFEQPIEIQTLYPRFDPYLLVLLWEVAPERAVHHISMNDRIQASFEHLRTFGRLGELDDGITDD
jgi:hypothetical protein